MVKLRSKNKMKLVPKTHAISSQPDARSGPQIWLCFCCGQCKQENMISYMIKLFIL